MTLTSNQEPVIQQLWTAPNGVPCKVRQLPRGALCGYVFVDEDVQMPLNVQVHGGVTGGHPGENGEWIGFDTGHACDDDATLPEELREGLHVWTVDTVREETERLAAQVPAPLPWPRWRFETQIGGALLVLRERTGETWASLRRIIRGKREVIWWHHAPRKCGEQRVTNLDAGAAALAARGCPPIPEAQLQLLRAWTPA